MPSAFWRRWFAISLALLVLLVAAAGAILYFQGRLPGLPGPPAQPANNEQPRGGSPPSRPEAPSASIGSGPSASSSWYQLFFTQPAYPDRAELHSGTSLDGQLVALIASAQKTIDAASYDFDLENVATALAAAQTRGVRVRFVTDTDTWTHRNPTIQKAWTILKAANIPIVDDQRGPIMHNKFMVVDAEWVWTGSWNWTSGDTYRLNNNAIQIKSKELAENYTVEFEKMFTLRKFGPTKPRGVPFPQITIQNVLVENYFAPEDDVTSHILNRISGATKSIQFMAFSFTLDKLGQALIGRHKAGVQVRGVFETTGSETQFSEYRALKQAGLDVMKDGNPYVMHHKVFIIDGKTVIFGSFNFSSNAEKDNDENLLIIDDLNLAEAFTAEMERVVSMAKNPPTRK